MKKTTKLIAILMAVMTLVNMVSIPVNAAETDPYCIICYDTAAGCNTVKFYKYVGDTAMYDYTRFVKFYSGKILLGESDIVVTTNHMAGTNPAWDPTGNYLIWLETSNSCYSRDYKTGQIRKIGDNASALNLNAESMVKSVTFSDGTNKSIKDLLASSTTVTLDEPTSKPSSNSGNTSKNSAIKRWTDSAGREHFKFGKNKVIVDGHDVYLNEYKISEFCYSSVRFVGIDSSHRVYLYENKTASFYRFKTSNVFKPDRIKFAKGTKLQNITVNSNGYLSKVVTSSGTFTVKQLAVDKTWYPKKNYAINKKGYCKYYLAETSKTYTLTLKGTKLYLGKKLIAKGITRKTDSFGFKGKYIRYVMKGCLYETKITSPKKVKIIKRGIKKLTYSKKNGCVKGAK